MKSFIPIDYTLSIQEAPQAKKQAGGKARPMIDTLERNREMIEHYKKLFYKHKALKDSAGTHARREHHARIMWEAHEKMLAISEACEDNPDQMIPCTDKGML